MTDHNPGANGRAEKGEAGDAGAKVVPFPRNWYGSVDELVPITPAAPRQPEAGSVADASVFWGGDGSEVTTSAPDPADRGWSDVEVDVSPDLGASGGDGPRMAQTAAHESPQIRSRAVRRSGRRSLPSGALVLVLIVLLAGVPVFLVMSGSGAHHTRRTAPPPKPALTVTQTVPQTTTVVQTVTRRTSAPVHHRSRRRSAYPRSVGDGGQKTVGASTSEVVAPPTTVSPSVPSGTSTSPPVIRPPATIGHTNSAGPVRTPGSSKPRCAPSVTNGGACSL